LKRTSLISVLESKALTKYLLIISIAAFLCPSCGTGSDTAREVPADSVLSIFVSVLPHSSIVKRIGKKHVNVSVMVKPGHSPATYEPTPRQLSLLAEAKIYFRTGVPFEHGFMEKIRSTYPRLKIIDMRSNVDMISMSPVLGGEESLDHGKIHHDHGSGPDPHIWLDPGRLMIQADTVFEALSAQAPEHRSCFRANLDALKKELKKLSEEFSRRLAPFRGRSFMIYHPSLGYFADAFGLRQLAVESGGKEPNSKALAALVQKGKEQKLKAVFIQKQLSQVSARLFASEIGARVISFDPLDSDVIGNIRMIGNTMAQVLAESGDE